MTHASLVPCRCLRRWRLRSPACLGPLLQGAPRLRAARAGGRGGCWLGKAWRRSPGRSVPSAETILTHQPSREAWCAHATGEVVKRVLFGIEKH